MTPSDSARDLPDVSLFASDGFNFSFYVVCASDQNVDGASCNLTTSPTSGTINFTGVGGTSGGTPAFAGIMALVNQMTVHTAREMPTTCSTTWRPNKTTPPEPANPATSPFPATPAPASCVFYDITTGNNSVACTLGSPNCTGVGNGNFGLLVDTSHPTYGNPAYEAGTGYDLATGLGSINVGNLLTLWTTANLTATTTTLGTPSTTSLTSGQTFTVPVTVSGGGTAAFPYGRRDQKTFSARSVLSRFPARPRPPAQICCHQLPLPSKRYYGGDVNPRWQCFRSVAVTVAGANQASKTTLNFVTFDSNNNPVPSTSSQTVSYGSPYILQMVVTNSSNATCLNNGNSSGTTPGSPCPKGTITLTDNGSALNDWPIAGQLNATNIAKLNNQGMAEDQPIQL